MPSTLEKLKNKPSRTFIDPATGATHKIPKVTKQLIRLNENNPIALYNLGTFELQDRNYPLAIELLSKSLKSSCTPETMVNLSTCLRNTGEEIKAAKLLEECIAKYPDFPLAYNNLGLIDYDYRRIDQAKSLYGKALELKPDYADAHWNYALANYLEMFNGPVDMAAYSANMDHFDWRFRKTNPVKIAAHDGAVWKGEPLNSGEQIMILSEQGIGDMIHFMRYMYNFDPGVACFHLPKFLWPMVREGYIATEYSNVPQTRYNIPMMSISKYFPISGAPYISWDKKKELAGDFKIGLVWKGNRQHANDKNRSRHYKDFYWLFKHGTVYNFQYDVSCNAKDILSTKIYNWEDTMTYINSVDIVISVDTSVVHLCGAMGKPCIVMIPSVGVDWRWGATGLKTPWYDSLRLARDMDFSVAESLLVEYKNGKW